MDLLAYNVYDNELLFTNSDVDKTDKMSWNIYKNEKSTIGEKVLYLIICIFYMYAELQIVNFSVPRKVF